MLTENLVLYKPERTTSGDDAGGYRTNIPIISDELHNVFPAPSSVAATYGNVAYQKVFLTAKEAGATLAGAHIILSEKPDNPDVSFVLFYTGSHSDELAELRDNVESYIVFGPKIDGELLERQIAGQRTIEIYQPINADLPNIGDVIIVSYLEGDENNGYYQYLRITGFEDEIRTFTGNVTCGTFDMRVLKLDLNEPLQHTFEGDVATCDSSAIHDTSIRLGSVADASNFYGVSSLSDIAAIGDTDISVESVFSRLAPSTQSEKTIVNQQVGGAKSFIMNTGGLDVSISDTAYTQKIDIVINNRGFSFATILRPTPLAETVNIEYKALGRWYKIYGLDTGLLEGNGNGIVDEVNGSLSFTLDALPDINSSIIITWAIKTLYYDEAGNTDISEFTIEKTLGTGALSPNSLTATWVGNGITYNASDDGLGNWTGDATGGASYNTGEIRFIPNKLPDSTGSITFNFEYAVNSGTVETPTVDGSGYIDITLPVSIEPGSLSVSWVVVHSQISRPTYTVSFDNGDLTFIAGLGNATVTLEDDSVGHLKGMPSSIVNYATGRIYFDPVLLLLLFHPEYLVTYNGYDYGHTTLAYASFTAASNVTFSYQATGLTAVPGQETVYAPTLKVPLTIIPKRVVVPKSLRLKIGTNDFFDNTGNGVIQNNTGASVGSIDYQNSIVEITVYQGGDNNIRTINSLITTDDVAFVWDFYYRSPGSPIKPGGLTITGTTLSGDNISAIAELNGTISDTLIEGNVDFENGIFYARVGELVPDISLTTEEKGEWWYDAGDIDVNGDIWKPDFIVPGSLKATIVYLYNLPLESDQLGINPTRLPPDGNIPIFRAGGLVVIHEITQVVLPDNLIADQAIDLSSFSRISLDSIRLLDQLDVVVIADKYSFDITTNLLTMANPLDLSAYTEPLIAEFQFEDMAVCSEVGIYGDLKITAPLKNNYTIAAKVSSAILVGDLYSAAANIFTQKTWAGLWDSYRVGDDSNAKYNSTQYPIVVSNEGSVKEKFALIFTTSTDFYVLGEKLGVILTSNTSIDTIPINGQTTKPYFTLAWQGWGSGWVQHNVLRFDVISASTAFWAIRTINTGAVINAVERAVIQPRGDSDN
ncbi:MAG: hypothetical protein KAH77_11250 [Thiomargarita sp.]|nr:hypothetical protein [Thiomargarita sp.]